MEVSPKKIVKASDVLQKFINDREHKTIGYTEPYLCHAFDVKPSRNVDPRGLREFNRLLKQFRPTNEEYNQERLYPIVEVEPRNLRPNNFPWFLHNEQRLLVAAYIYNSLREKGL